MLHIMRSAGVGLVVQVDGDRIPRVVHWGADPGDLDQAGSDGYRSSALSLLPMQHEGWAGRPAVAGDRAGLWPHLRLRLAEPVALTDSSLSLRARDEAAGVEVTCDISISPEGVLSARQSITNTGVDIWSLAGVRCMLPIPDEATDLLDLTGRWALERFPQRSDFRYGAHARESRRGRTGHDATILLCLGTPGFANRSGQVWTVHVGWSGNHEHTAERLPDSVGTLGGGELLDPGEVRLAPGETYHSPTVYFVWSPSGLDGVRDRFHRFLRARDSHPRTPRPVVLNTWEAVYFNHDLDKLRRLADRAAQIGVERFVLDDGWFGKRRNDSAGLGDWFVSPDIWPDGLGPLADYVHSLGMQFGLWFEPEMVNPDSDLARAHPDWILAAPGRWPAEHRQQQVLDISRAEAFAYLLERLDSLVTEYGIDYIKWDHNRDLVEAVHQDGRAGVHRQTLAIYRLLEQLRTRHPRLEIESCSSGGARIDLGILAHTDRVWASDTNDPLDRQQIQQWTSLLLPLELLGSHVGAARAHVTGRVADLPIRCATALFGHAGLEWDLTACPPDELELLAEWIALYKRTRALLHSGRMVTPDRNDPSAHVVGVVAPDGRHALFSYAQLASSPANSPIGHNPMRLRLPGLLPDQHYQATTVIKPAGGTNPPTGAGLDPVMLTGSALETIGLVLPRLKPVDATVFELRAVDRP